MKFPSVGRAGYREPDESGISIIETVLALTILAIVMVGLTTSVGFGLRLTGQSNSRQAATQVATRAMEVFRAADYSTLGMDPATTYETGVPGSPDQNVDESTDPPTFTVPLGNPVTEEIVEDGLVEHKPAVTSIRNRQFQLYQYVTWPTAAEDSKRVTIVVQWSESGRVTDTVVSSIFTTGQIGFPSSTTTSSTTTPSTTTTSSTTTTTTLTECPGDETGPTVSRFDIADGQGADGVDYVNSRTVQLQSYAVDPEGCTPVWVQFSNDAGATWSSPTEVVQDPTVVDWVLSDGDGEKTVHARFADGAGNHSALASDSVTLDTSNPHWEPADSANLVADVSKSGNSLWADLTWDNTARDGSLDGDYVAKYDIYRRVGSTGSFAVHASVAVDPEGTSGCLASGAQCTYEDPDLSKNTTYTYRIVAVDRAGNNSEPSNERSCTPPNSNGTATCA